MVWEIRTVPPQSGLMINVIPQHGLRLIQDLGHFIFVADAVDGFL